MFPDPVADLIEATDKLITHDERPAVYISGGLDSTVVLHCLTQVLKATTIHTYTMSFGTSTDETEKAQRVADHYGTVHKEIHMGNYIEILHDISVWFDKPHFNIWPFWLAAAATADKCTSAWIGEGSDEIFGGYAHGDYLLGWAGQLIWVQPAFQIIHRKFKLPLMQPFMALDLHTYRQEFQPPNKGYLRGACAGILQPEVLKDDNSQPPGFTRYAELLDIPESTDVQAKERLIRVATALWLQAQAGDKNEEAQIERKLLGS